MKSIFASKTLWLNALTLAGAALTYVVNHDLFAQNPDLSAALVSVLALVNIGLRLVTTTGVTVSKTEE